MELTRTYFKEQIIFYTKCSTFDEVREKYNLEPLNFTDLDECYRITPKSITN